MGYNMTDAIKVTKVTKKKVTKKKVATKKPKNYLNNKDMLVQWQLSHDQDSINDTFAAMMMLLTKRYSSKVRFNVCDTFREDMESFALMTVSKVWRSFNPEKSNNPFAYFTQVIKRAFYQYQNLERRQRDISNESLIEKGQSPSHAYMVEYEYKNFNPEDAGGDISTYSAEGELTELINPHDHTARRELERERLEREKEA
jgi:hypothetical protein